MTITWGTTLRSAASGRLRTTGWKGQSAYHQTHKAKGRRRKPTLRTQKGMHMAPTPVKWIKCKRTTIKESEKKRQKIKNQNLCLTLANPVFGYGGLWSQHSKKKARRSGIQDTLPCLNCIFEASMEYMRPCLQKRERKTHKHRETGREHVCEHTQADYWMPLTNHPINLTSDLTYLFLFHLIWDISFDSSCQLISKRCRSFLQAKKEKKENHYFLTKYYSLLLDI